jgi:hypothetical protein
MPQRGLGNASAAVRRYFLDGDSSPIGGQIQVTVARCGIPQISRPLTFLDSVPVRILM